MRVKRWKDARVRVSHLEEPRGDLGLAPHPDVPLLPRGHLGGLATNISVNRYIVDCKVTNILKLIFD